MSRNPSHSHRTFWCHGLWMNSSVMSHAATAPTAAGTPLQARTIRYIRGGEFNPVSWRNISISLIDDRRDFAAGQPQVRLKLAAADRSCTSRAGWPIHEVEHVIEGRGQPVDVLAIERCDECLVEFRDNRPEALWPASTRPVAAGPPDFPGCCAVNARPR